MFLFLPLIPDPDTNSGKAERRPSVVIGFEYQLPVSLPGYYGREDGTIMGVLQASQAIHPRPSSLALQILIQQPQMIRYKSR